jgi:hypothetical protein
MLPPLAGALALEPGGNGHPLVTAIAAELDVGNRARASLFSDPTDRHVQALCNLAGVEKAIGHGAPSCLVTSRAAVTWQQRRRDGQLQLHFRRRGS